MKTRKMLIMFLCLIMLVLSLTACGSDDDESDGENIENGGGETDDGETVTLTLGIWDTYQEPILREIADNFQETHENIKIEIQLTPWDQYWTKLETAATGEVLPDVFWINGPNIVRYASNGMIMPIGDKVEAEGLDMELFPGGLVDLYTVEGELYGIPKDWDLTALWYNKELFDAKDLEYPNENWTWDDMVEAARTLTDEENGVYGIAARSKTQEGIYDTIPQAGGYIINEERTESGYDSPEAIAGTQIWVDLIEEGLSPTLQEMADTNELDMFANGQVAMVYAASWNVPVFMQNENIADKIDLTVMPLIEERAATIHGLANAISANTEYPEEAWEFVKYLASEEANQIWADSGVVIPAHTDVLDTWVDAYPDINLQAYVDQLDYAVMYPVSGETAKWNDLENTSLREMWSGETSVEAGLQTLADGMNAVLENE